MPHDYSFEDNNVFPGTYSYRLKQIDRNGAFRYSQEVKVDLGAAPKEFRLSENYPNPFNPTTNIEFTVRDNGPATLKVYNIAGQLWQSCSTGVQKRAGFILKPLIRTGSLGNLLLRPSNGQPAARSQNDAAEIKR